VFQDQAKRALHIGNTVRYADKQPLCTLLTLQLPTTTTTEWTARVLPGCKDVSTIGMAAWRLLPLPCSWRQTPTRRHSTGARSSPPPLTFHPLIIYELQKCSLSANLKTLPALFHKARKWQLLHELPWDSAAGTPVVL
jgi:hypothetical protein